MKQLKYNKTQTIRFDFPTEWQADVITSATLALFGSDGTELLSASALTIASSTTLDGAVSRYSDSITLASGSDELAPGDRILLTGAAGHEHRIVEGYDTLVATLEKYVDQDYDDDDAVYYCNGTIEIDLTTVATFVLGKQITLQWTANTGQSVTQLATISHTTAEIEGLEGRFRDLYPRAYKKFADEDKYARMQKEATRQIELELQSNNLSLHRVVDTDILAPSIMAKMAFMWAMAGDETKEEERNDYSKEYSDSFLLLTRNPIWVDVDQDLVQDDDEIDSYENIFERRW